MNKSDVLITEAEWQALYLASRPLREVGAGLRRTGAEELAMESVRHAEILEALGQRAIVEAARDHSAELEAEH